MDEKFLKIIEILDFRFIPGIEGAFYRINGCAFHFSLFMLLFLL